MTKLSILSATEQKRFDSPPKFTLDERRLHFCLTNEILELTQKIRSPANKVGFLLQIGYFKATGKFFTVEQFYKQDIEYACKILGIDYKYIHIFSYKRKTPLDHKKQILTLLEWQPFNKDQQQKITGHLKWLVQKQQSPKHLFLSAIDFCWQNKIELPSYYVLAAFITDAYNHFEQEVITILANKLTQHHKEKLDLLMGAENKKAMERPLITRLKQINQSLRPMDIQENVEAFKTFKTLFFEFQSIFNELNLSDQATEYFSTWVQKSKIFQLYQFNNKNKIYLYLLCYIKHNFYFRHDVLIDIFLKSVNSVGHSAHKKLQQHEKENRAERNKAIRKLSKTSQDSRDLIEKITEIIKSPTISDAGKLSKIEAFLNQYYTEYDATKKLLTIELEKMLKENINNQIFFNLLETLSFKLQRKVSSIVKVLEINKNTSSIPLVEAIAHFRKSDGEVNRSSLTEKEIINNGTYQKTKAKLPIDFLDTDEREGVYSEDKIRISLYKILLFTHMETAIKSGAINFLYSYRYKAIHEYLIDENLWKQKRNDLLGNSGLFGFDNFRNIINNLKTQLNDKYQVANNRLINSENNYITIDKNKKVKVYTPKIDSDEAQYISSLLSQAGFVPILQILSDVNNVTLFTHSFKHFSNKHKKMKPDPNLVFAGIIGKGCNIGIRRIANISIGISEDTLKNTVNWCFSLKNIQQANNKIIGFINKLFLANAYRHEFDHLHTGSDGRKVNVAVDSLLASYSFKYFGKGKGVSIYTFLDERQLLFHSTVISSSEREAAYVIDGLLENEVVKSNIHSTDTHGFTETIFAAAHFIGTAFAPRIKNIGKQNIYAFSARKTYEDRGYKILPSRTINLNLIEESWDDILRFMATIKLKHAPASQLFKRLSSYSKDHPLYRALKEFGRIIKSIFILTYFDDVELRQRIEKQLNRVELSNKFSKAVFFANNQEFKHGTKEEQEIITACKVLIQNAIVLWNYLSLSQLIINSANVEERVHMLASIRKGSIITWQHINLQGEYDFTKHATNDNRFNMEKILELKFA
jgi:TnpA family transposase